MSIVTVLLRLGTTVVTSKVAEKAVEQLATVITARMTKPLPPPQIGPDDPVQAQIASLQERIEQQEQRIATLGSTLAGLGDALRPLIVRSAVAFWTAVASAIISVVALLMAIRS